MSESLTTRERIEKAIDEMSAANCDLTVTAVAAEAGTSHSNIYNNYKDLVLRIHDLAGKADEANIKSTLSKRSGNIKRLKDRNKKLRIELEEKNEELRKADSINASLDLENQSLKAEVADLQNQLRDALKISVLAHANKTTQSS